MITKLSPGNAGWSEMRVTSGLARLLKRDMTVAPYFVRSRPPRYPSVAVEKTNGPQIKYEG